MTSNPKDALLKYFRIWFITVLVLLVALPVTAASGHAFVSLIPAALLIGAFLHFYWRFLKPALALFENAQSAPRKPELLTKGVTGPWRDWADAMALTLSPSESHLASIEDSARFTSAIFEAALDCVISMDEQGNIKEFNPAAERTFGWKRDQVLGRPLGDVIVPPHLRAAHFAGFKRYLETGSARVLGRRIEVEGLRANGQVFPIELGIVETKHKGERLFIAFLRDLTERKAFEVEVARQREALHQSEKLAALGSLLAGVSHELNNPLSVVVGRAAMLEEDIKDPALVASVKKLRAAADRCGRIVKTFLAMARQSQPRRTAVRLNQVIETALDIAAYALRSSGVEVVKEFDPYLPVTSGDEDQLAQVFINLAINAQQAMADQNRSRKLTLRTRYDAAADTIIAEVQDTGPGIPPEIRPRIFEPFFTTKKIGTGTGVGLAVSLGMVQAHSGNITLNTEVGVGSTFIVTLPVAKPAAAVESDHPQAVTDKAGRRALIVDDEEEVAAVLQDCLRPIGFESDAVSDGRRGLEQVASTRYDVVLCDLRMPGMDGIEFHRQLRQKQPDLARRLVFISGDVLSKDLGQLTGQSEQPVIEKPFDPVQVRSVVQGLVETI